VEHPFLEHSMLTLLLAFTLYADPEPMPLYTGKVPFLTSEDPAAKPTLTPYLPAREKATGTAVVVCPGGGYGALAMDHEGKQIAQWLNDRGIAAFVLKYRIAGKYHPAPVHPAPLTDAQRAIRTVRHGASKWNINGTKVGIWGFSAGGHLASSAATHFDSGLKEAADDIDKVSSRPDFAILGYPVISMKAPYTHGGSRNNLLGKNADAALVESFCNENAVTKETPPTFLFHTDEDKAVPPMNSILFYSALKKHGVPAELHIYEKGVHGVGLAPLEKFKDKGLSGWPDRLQEWLTRRGLCK
jgi:acetyl esterase/lipase